MPYYLGKERVKKLYVAFSLGVPVAYSVDFLSHGVPLTE